MPGVAQMQIVQEKIDRFTFNIVKDPSFCAASLDKLANLVNERFGANVEYNCVFQDKIPQEPSGKYRFCISKVQKTFI